MFKRTKYGARKTVVDGIEFHSGKEARRYAELKLLEKAGLIEFLALQPRYILQDKFRDKNNKAIRAIEYIPDFRYLDHTGDKSVEVAEDVKGMRTEVYKLKAKLFKAKYPHIELRET